MLDMSPEKFLQAQQVADILIKGVIAIAVAVAGYHFKDINSKISQLELHDSEKAVKLAVTESTVASVAKQMDRIEAKLDSLVAYAKKVQ